jgi:CubicO group peptidase (beta-lactamase class C family)
VDVLVEFVASLTIVLAPADATRAPRGLGLPRATPESVEMSSMRLAAVQRVITRGHREGGFPGAAAIIGRKGRSILQSAVGTTSWQPGAPAVSVDSTIYDLASLTKVVGTTTAIMLLYDEGKVTLDEPVKTYLPEFSGGMRDSVTVRHLLTHRSGLPAGIDLWRLSNSPAEAREMVLAEQLVARPGDRYIYSDLGADLLGFIAERQAGMPLDQFLMRKVFVPLGMSDTWFRVPERHRWRAAPTEMLSPRGYSLQGEVHDENAYALGGIAGHAGLFSTASDLGMFAQMMINRGELHGVRIVSDTTVDRFTARAAGTRALGWDTCDGQGGCGQYLSPRSYGHTGFTGTSIWIDPDREMFVVLLTNRVYESRARRPERVIADVRADLADAAAWAVTDPSVTVRGPEQEPLYRADFASGWNPVPEPVYRRVATTCGVSRGRALARRTARGRSARRGRAVSSRCASTRGGKTVLTKKSKRGRASAASSRSSRSSRVSAATSRRGRVSAAAARRGKASASTRRTTAKSSSARSRQTTASSARRRKR